MTTAVAIEWRKLRRSWVVLIATVALVVFLPLLGWGFISVAARGGAGAVAAKADLLLFGDGWVGYLRAVDQVAAAATLVGAGVVVTWIFGREHVDHTFGALFCLPISRVTIAGAKFVVLTAWAATLAMLVAGVAVIVGFLTNVGGTTSGVPLAEVTRLALIVAATVVLTFPLAVIASLARGYLAAIGATVVLIAVTQVAVLLGTGGWFPFAVPGLLAVAGQSGMPTVNAGQLLLVPATGVLGGLLTMWAWRRTEVA